MDKDRVEGSMKNVKGKMKEGAGKLVGDEKTKREGQTEQASGKAQNTYGSAKDKLRGE